METVLIMETCVYKRDNTVCAFKFLAMGAVVNFNRFKHSHLSYENEVQDPVRQLVANVGWCLRACLCVCVWGWVFVHCIFLASSSCQAFRRPVH